MRLTLTNTVVGALLLATLTLFIVGPAPRVAPRVELPPTPAALAFAAAQAEAAARADAARRQAEAARAIQATAEEESVLPEGPGRAETFGYCVACHNTAIIRRSHFNRDQWDGLMDWMTERHAMNPLEGELRRVIVDYLAQHFGPAQQPARARNPFLN